MCAGVSSTEYFWACAIHTWMCIILHADICIWMPVYMHVEVGGQLWVVYSIISSP